MDSISKYISGPGVDRNVPHQDMRPGFLSEIVFPDCSKSIRLAISTAMVITGVITLPFLIGGLLIALGTVLLVSSVRCGDTPTWSSSESSSDVEHYFQLPE